MSVTNPTSTTSVTATFPKAFSSTHYCVSVIHVTSGTVASDNFIRGITTQKSTSVVIVIKNVTTAMLSKVIAIGH